MEITWFGHSCFRIDMAKSSILIDPLLTGNPTFEDSGLTVRQASKGVTHVALTHGHEDHTGDSVAICKETGAPLIAVFELAMHMASLGVEKIDPRILTSPSCRPGTRRGFSTRDARSISAPAAAW
jgi:L-ascorbate metabolism protein UlaG (beta-lactamase superfamily)